MNTPDAATTANGWLSPAAALNRYVPSERLAFAGAGLERRQVQFGFRIGDFGLLVPTSTGTEVVKATTFARIPKSAPWLQGIYNLRGNLVPVIDLAVHLGIVRPLGRADTPAADDSTPHILIFGKGDRAVGVTIDGFPQALTDLRPVSHPPDQQKLERLHVSAAFTTGADLWFEFDPESLFSALAQAH